MLSSEAEPCGYARERELTSWATDGARPQTSGRGLGSSPYTPPCLGKTKIYELQSQGSFPMRVQITSHSVGWVEQEVQAWLTKRAATRAPLTTKQDP
jgi:hypothetical protein